MSHFEYIEDFLYKKEADYLQSFLEEEIPWRQVRYFKPERGYVITPRLTWCAGFHNNLYYKINNITPNPIPKTILPLKEIIEDYTGTTYNFVLFAKYRNGQDSITYHSDDEMFLGKNPTIPLLTIGSTRPFNLKNKIDRSVQSFDLSHGDLLIMKNDCQRNFQHAVPKVDNFNEVRYSITFRKAINEYGTKNYYTYNVGNELDFK